MTDKEQELKEVTADLDGRKTYWSKEEVQRDERKRLRLLEEIKNEKSIN